MELARPPVPGRLRGASWWRVSLSLLAAVSIGAGVLGLTRYVGNYSVYRGFTPPTHSATIPFGSVTTGHFRSGALGRSTGYVIYIPPRYRTAAARGVRFPVLYLLHSPRGTPEGYVKVGALAVRMDELIASHRIRPFIVVMPDGRTSKYHSDTEWANAAAGRYESFVIDTVRAVDQRFATVQSRTGRVVGGLSMGGYGAANVALHHLQVFGGFESWSGYFTQTPTASFRGAPSSLLRANSPSAYVGSLRPALTRLPLRALLYQGAQDHASSLSGMFHFGAQLRAAGARIRLAVFHGGHNWRLWRERLPMTLRYTSHVFAAGSRSPR